MLRTEQETQNLLEDAYRVASTDDFQASAVVASMAAAAIASLEAQERTNYLLETLVNAQAENSSVEWRILEELVNLRLRD